MDLYLANLCAYSDAEFSALKQKVDSCSAMGRSYELPCILPNDCVPSRAALCFWNDCGYYRVYIQPGILYRGEITEFMRLLSPQPPSFSDFDSAVRYLRDLSLALRGDHTLHPDTPQLCRKLEAALSLRVIGQEQAVRTAAYRVYAHISKTAPCRPLSMILHGPTGVGKSELAKSIPLILRHLFPEDNWRSVWTDLNTYTQPHSVSRLLGSPPGYVGYDDTPVLEAIRHSPRTVFIFDELEKAHPEILKVFMSILDEGRCTAHREDSTGNRDLDFRRCIFLFTTNLDLSSRAIRQTIGFAAPQHPANSESDANHLPLPHPMIADDDIGRRALVNSGVLQEIAGRFSAVIGFHPLDLPSRHTITAMQIASLGLEFGIHVASIAPDLISVLTAAHLFSVRSEFPVLEQILVPYFAQCSGNYAAIPLHLSGTPEHPVLTPIMP